MFDLDPTLPNIWPGRYRHVAVTSRPPALDEETLRAHVVGTEVYYRTRYLVVRRAGATALAEVSVEPGDGLFLVVDDLRILAGPENCRDVRDADVDVGIPSAMATLVEEPGPGALVVEGRYGHLSFILNPEPLDLEVLDVLDPRPSKLIDQVERILSVAEDLPPVRVVPEVIDITTVLATDLPEPPTDVLLPCRGSGITGIPATLHHLDERPERAPWVLLGCDRSQRIHDWFYGERADLVDVCPRRFHPDDPPPGRVLSRCCMLQEGIGTRGDVHEVPWGANLAEVREAIEAVIERARAAGSFGWHRT